MTRVTLFVLCTAGLYDIATRGISRITNTPEAEFSGDSSWTAVANLAAFGLHDVTRLAISPRGVIASPLLHRRSEEHALQRLLVSQEARHEFERQIRIRHLDGEGKIRR